MLLKGAPPALRSISKAVAFVLLLVQRRVSWPIAPAVTFKSDGAAGAGEGRTVGRVLLMKMEMVPFDELPTATSGCPSPLKSPMASVRTLSPPEAKETGA